MCQEQDQYTGKWGNFNRFVAIVSIPMHLNLAHIVRMGNPEGILVANLRRFRQKMGLTQSELAEAAKLPFRTYQNYEYGKSEPDAQALEAISGALNVPISSLWENPNDPRRPLSFADASALLAAVAGAGPAHQGVLLALALGDPGRIPAHVPDAVRQAVEALLKSLKSSL
jgi:transcriptional regulator with XRE-family HTH domain